MKKFLKNLGPIFAIIAVIGILMPNLVMAADPATPAQTPPPPTSSLTCEDLGQPNKTQNYIITILEEEIGNQEVKGDTESTIFCYRVTTTDKGVQKSEYAKDCKPSSTKICQRVQVLIAKSGAALLYSYIGLIYKWAAGTIGIISVLYLVYGGVLIATAGDNPGQVDKAKEKIFQSIAGLILLFLSAVILYTINPNFFTA